MTSIKVAILDDHRTLAEGLAAKLSKESDLEILVTEYEWTTFWQKIKNQPIHIAILDIQLGGKSEIADGLQIAQKIQTDKPETKCMILSGYSTSSRVKRAVEIGVNGYFTKSEPIEKLAAAIRDIVHRGETRYSDEVAAMIRKGFVHLTEKEKEILAYISRGMNVPQIAEETGKSKELIARHKKNITAKLNISNVEALVKWGIDNGYSSYPLP